MSDVVPSDPLSRPAGFFERVARWRNGCGWCFVLGLILLQAILYREYARRELTPFPPRNHDQVCYLYTSHEIDAQMQEHGVLAGLFWGLKYPATGVVLQTEAALLFQVAGPSRVTALAVSFLHFALFQVVLVATLLWLSRRWSVALTGLALLLMAGTTFYFAGGLFDFRMDFLAFCLYGIFLCLVVRSRFFHSRRWSAAAGAAAAYLVVARFITAVYLIGLLGICGGALVLLAWRRSSLHLRREARRRLTGVLLTGFVCLVGVLPEFIQQAPVLYRYYVVSQLAEKEIRAAECGTTTWREYLLFYPRSLGGTHAGPTFLAVSGCLLLAALLLSWRRRSAGSSPPTSQGLRGFSLGGGYLILAAALGFPLLVLTTNPAKSPVVANILVPALLWLVLLPLAWAARQEGSRSRRSSAVLLVVALFAMLGAVREVRSGTTTNPIWGNDRATPWQTRQLFKDMTARCHAEGWTKPIVSMNVILDVLAPPVGAILAYERDRSVIFFGGLLGCSLLPVDEAKARADLDRSQFVILCRDDRLGNPAHPFTQSMKVLQPMIRAYCEQELEHMGTYSVFGERVDVYVRPSTPKDGSRSERS
jgi:hypothetical protein